MKKTLFLLLACCFAANSCGNGNAVASTGSGNQGGSEPRQKIDSRIPARKENTLNLATYNVGVFNKSGVNSCDMVAKMMKEWDLDALSLNELDSCNTRSGLYTYQLKDFAKAMGEWNYNFAGAIAYKSGTYGVGAVTPRKVVNSWTIKLPKSNDSEVRALSVIETEKFVFCNTHLGLKDQAQLDQINVIDDFISAHFGGSAKPVFLCGDMNAEPGSKTLEALAKEWECLSRIDDTTFSTSNPIKCIDFIFRYRNAGRASCSVSFVGKSFEGGDPLKASDHFPVFVQVEL